MKFKKLLSGWLEILHNFNIKVFFQRKIIFLQVIFWTSGVFSITHIKSISILLKTFSFLLHLCIVHSKDLIKNHMNLVCCFTLTKPKTNTNTVFFYPLKKDFKLIDDKGPSNYLSNIVIICCKKIKWLLRC